MVILQETVPVHYAWTSWNTKTAYVLGWNSHGVCRRCCRGVLGNVKGASVGSCPEPKRNETSDHGQAQQGWEKPGKPVFTWS